VFRFLQCVGAAALAPNLSDIPENVLFPPLHETASVEAAEREENRRLVRDYI